MTPDQREKEQEVLYKYAYDYTIGTTGSLDAIAAIMAPQWLPVAEAPKDGTPILCQFQYGSDVFVSSPPSCRRKGARMRDKNTWYFLMSQGNQVRLPQVADCAPLFRTKKALMKWASAHKLKQIEAIPVHVIDLRSPR